MLSFSKADREEIWARNAMNRTDLGNHDRQGSEALIPSDARIWRITHRDNLKYILSEGLVAQSFSIYHPDWVSIGDREIIDRRAETCVPGTDIRLSQCVPFYFTPFSPMLLNILSGRRVQQRTRSEIVIFETSLHHIARAGLRYFFTSEHALSNMASFYTDLSDVDKIDWDIIRKRDFSRDADDPNKMVRYQAEALVFDRCPINLMSCIHCYDEETKQRINTEILETDPKISVPVIISKEWYF